MKGRGNMIFGDMDVRVIRTRRTTCSIYVDRDGKVTFRGPLGISDAMVRRILEEKKDWIFKKTEAASVKAAAASREEKLTPAQIRCLAEQAVKDLPPRAERFARLLGVDYGRITVRCQKTRWGSCSSKGDLNFNCLLMLCPAEIRDYVVAHELCHRLEMNHSARFWARVESVLPDWRRRKKWLRDNGGVLMRRAHE